jgi:hypothetical protein
MTAKERQDVLRMLAATPDTLRVVAGTLSDDAAARRPDPEEWSAGEVVAHLVDAEVSWFKRIHLMVDEDRPRLVWYSNPDYSLPPLRESLDTFLRMRTEDVAYLEALPERAWERTGDHEHWGHIDVIWAGRHLAAHDADHLAQISRAVAAR